METVNENETRNEEGKISISDLMKNIFHFFKDVLVGDKSSESNIGTEESEAQIEEFIKKGSNLSSEQIEEIIGTLRNTNGEMESLIQSKKVEHNRRRLHAIDGQGDKDGQDDKIVRIKARKSENIKSAERDERDNIA